MKHINFINFLSGIFKDRMFRYHQFIYYRCALKAFLQTFTIFCQLCQLFTNSDYLPPTLSRYLSQFSQIGATLRISYTRSKSQFCLTYFIFNSMFIR